MTSAPPFSLGAPVPIARGVAGSSTTSIIQAPKPFDAAVVADSARLITRQGQGSLPCR